MLIFILAGCGANPQVTEQKQSQESSSLAPNFNLPDIYGNKVVLSKLRRKVVIINFWATWCSPCREEIPGFIRLYDKYEDKGLQIIGISLDRTTKENLANFVKEWGINYPIILGDNKIVKDYGGIRAIPTTFIIDKKGKIINKHIGYVSEEVFEKQIQALLAG